MRIFSFIFLLLLFADSAAQKNYLDSLKLSVSKFDNDTNKVILLYKIRDIEVNTNPDIALAYSDSAYLLSTKLQYIKGQVFGLLNSGEYYQNRAEYGKAADLLFKALKLADQNESKNLLGSCYNKIAVCFCYQQKFEKGLEYFSLALKNYELSNNIKSQGIMYNNIASTYYYIEYYKYQKTNIISFPNTLENHQKALKIFEKLNDSSQIMLSYSNLGMLYSDMKEYDKSLKYLGVAAKIADALHGQQDKIFIMGNTARTYRYMEQNDKAIRLYEQSLEIAKQLGNTSLIKDRYYDLMETYEHLEKYKEAFDWFQKYYLLYDSLSAFQSAKQLSELEAVYQNEQKQKEIELLNEKDKSNKIIQYALAGGTVLLLLFALLLYNRYRLKQKANNMLEQQNNEIHEQKNLIEEKNKDITDSIKYAQRIQNAILPSPDQIKNLLPHCFVFFKPKDIVSGDFFWFDKFGDKVFFAAVDCTGHGVPGAIMSMLGYNLLNQSLNEHGLSKPNLILNALNKGVSKTLRQKSADYSVNDGMDIALCAIDFNTLTLEYAGANNSLYLISNGKITEINADKIAIGTYDSGKTESYTNNELKLNKGDTIYVFTDGFADQFGGPKGKKFKYKQLQQVLLDNAHLPAEEQRKKLNTIFGNWKGELEQIDDVCIIGVKI
jgi:serine phosphatase RsbU (regulator of sigma subunit)